MRQKCLRVSLLSSLTNIKFNLQIIHLDDSITVLQSVQQINFILVTGNGFIVRIFHVYYFNCPKIAGLIQYFIDLLEMLILKRFERESILNKYSSYHSFYGLFTQSLNGSGNGTKYHAKVFTLRVGMRMGPGTV